MWARAHQQMGRKNCHRYVGRDTCLVLAGLQNTYGSKLLERVLRLGIRSEQKVRYYQLARPLEALKLGHADGSDLMQLS